MDRCYYIWFNDFVKIDDKVKRKLFTLYKNPKRIYQLSRNELDKITFLSEENKQKIQCSRSILNIANINSFIEKLDKMHINMININDANYYCKLKNIYDFPYNLYYKGNIYNQNEKMIAIVGSRNATSYGLDLAYRIAYDLAKEGMVIVSGMAKGIDSFAHHGALAAGGKTIGVLGSGLNVCYPKENYGLMKQIEKEGMLISEYYLDTKPLKENFPKRNRIISALADFILVVEARENSGSLITVNYALEYGKDIGAVPGNVNDEHYIGTNSIIKDGAFLIRNAKDILEILQ